MEEMNKQKQQTKSETWEWIKALVVALILMFVIRQFIVAPVIVDGESMLPTLEDRDRMIVNKLSYVFGEPERFDIIVFHAPGGKDYIKRIIGLPGDTVEFRDNTLYVNNEEVEELYLERLKEMYGGTIPISEFIIEDIPEDHVFVLGDHLPASRDSRNIGPVHIDEIVGKANVVFWPIKNMQIAK